MFSYFVELFCFLEELNFFRPFLPPYCTECARSKEFYWVSTKQKIQQKSVVFWKFREKSIFAAT